MIGRSTRAHALALALAALTLARVGAAESPAAAPVDPASRLADRGSASEYWDLVARLGGGIVVTARITITNEGPGERSAAAFGHVLRPGAAPVVFQNGRREERWRLSGDGRRIEIGSSLLDLKAGARHFEVDNDKRGVKLFLDWSEDASARRVPAAALPPGYAIDVLQLATPVHASIHVAGMPALERLEGTLGLTHTSMPESEGELVLRRIDLMTTDPGSGTFLVDILRPAGERLAWLSARTGAQELARSDLRIRSENRGAAGSYPNPSALAWSGAGVQGTATFGPALLEVDPLAALPAFLRMVYSLRGRPHRSWADSALELSWVPGQGRPAVRIAGGAIASLTYLDALPPNESQIRP